MLMTEQEARTKWCPHYRQYQGEDATGDNRPGGGFNPLCIASDCMAWRWADPAEKHERRQCETCGGTGGTEERACMDCEGEGVRLHPYPTPARRGYCGAFGHPEA